MPFEIVAAAFGEEILTAVVGEEIFAGAATEVLSDAGLSAADALIGGGGAEGTVGAANLAAGATDVGLGATDASLGAAGAANAAAAPSGVPSWLKTLGIQTASSAAGSLVGGLVGAGAKPLVPTTVRPPAPPASQAAMSPTYASISASTAAKYAAQASNDDVSVDNASLNVGTNGKNRNTLLTGGGSGNSKTGD